MIVNINISFSSESSFIHPVNTIIQLADTMTSSQSHSMESSRPPPEKQLAMMTYNHVPGEWVTHWVMSQNMPTLTKNLSDSNTNTWTLR